MIVDSVLLRLAPNQPKRACLLKILGFIGCARADIFLIVAVRVLRKLKGVFSYSLECALQELCEFPLIQRQEGVEDGIYVPIEVNVHTEAGKVLTCRSYQMKDYVCGPPSPQYKKVICMGAKQNGLPTDYQKKLEAIETNNYTGTLPIMEEIEAAIKAKKINSA
ncbi:gamma-glutamylcyclotransferase isoform X2 [Egretta garzetta]|uniref:gamma-glutamylcyclotransferase isoform X2 n=1 Tax=Egretta garzetta TaxID=188379 RepID=UPI00163CFFB7|nr:gamma-glutamylcyclotransferase isoform X2 [Egretta garzetta]XP_035751597.1 gamma-glutamylcyclotransferase isoform X2 [Egretta garzetta]XP_035751598.1 gamma-glutamylcyclotransferase isoform X2 [Egretta garzetta]XP_035751599.1 gamma-glutamylcyclotransferase isoform X2 [Egretta garzetta]